MSTVLAIETSTELASVALHRQGRVIRLESAGAQTHSRSVLPMVGRLLAEAGIPLSACDAIAFGCGPGSFTGVRTACGVAQGLAYGADLRVLPVVTLEAMAQACRAATGAQEVWAVLDARMGEVYWAQYRYEGKWQAVSPPALNRPGELGIEPSFTACGNGLEVYRAHFPASIRLEHAYPAIAPHAIFVAELAVSALQAGLSLPAHEARPLYLRDKVARTVEERMTQTAA
jgi:tRNA threonylcarbamoyladenosine biosynthesis protein TsaB